MRHAPCRTLALLIAATAALGGCRRPGPEAPADAARVASPPDAAAPLDPLAAEQVAVFDKVAKIFSCFEGRLRESRKEPAFAAFRRTSFTDIFFFDHLFGERDAIERPPGELCEAALKDYRALFLATAARRERIPRAVAAKGPLSRPIDAEPDFLRAAKGRTGLHLLAHAELTRAVLLEAVGGRVRPVFDTVVLGAQQADIYRWPDLRFHGQTEAHDLAHREAETATGQAAFVGAVAGLIDHFNEEIRDGRCDHAALYLGVACHAAQDVAFHRGMTRRQLAGLRFFEKEDLYASPGAEVRAEARRWTKEIVGMARAAVGGKAWERFLAWAPPAGFDLESATRAIFSDDPLEQRLVWGVLTRLWLSQLVYRRSPETRKELGAGPEGIVRWEIAPLFARIRTSIVNGGIALHEKGR
jgi:hypothetical protein